MELLKERTLMLLIPLQERRMKNLDRKWTTLEYNDTNHQGSKTG